MLAVFVRARKSGDPPARGVSTRILVSFPVHLHASSTRLTAARTAYDTAVRAVVLDSAVCRSSPTAGAGGRRAACGCRRAASVVPTSRSSVARRPARARPRGRGRVGERRACDGDAPRPVRDVRALPRRSQSTCGEFRELRIAPGGFAEHLRASHCVPLPDSLRDHDGIWVEPLACVLRAAELVPPGRVLVVGAGAIGRLWIQVPILRGHEVLAADPRADRLAGARGLGAEVDDGPVAAAVLTARRASARPSSGSSRRYACRLRGARGGSSRLARRGLPKELVVRGFRSATRRTSATPSIAAAARAAAGDDAAARTFPRRRRALSPRRRAQGRLHTVKAARLYAPGDLRVEDVPRPEPGPGDVLVQIEVAINDGTDLKAFRRGHRCSRASHLRRSGTSSGGSSTVAVSSRRTPCRAVTVTAVRAVSSAARSSSSEGRTPTGSSCRSASPRSTCIRFRRRSARGAAMVEPLACCLRGVERAGGRYAGDRV